MHAAVTQDAQLENAAYSALLLKVSENELVQRFELSLKETLESVGAGHDGDESQNPVRFLSIEPEEKPDPAVEAAFSASDALFQKLCGKAAANKVSGLAPYGKELFLNAVRTTFSKSRIEGTEVTRLMPYACRALDAELLKVYRKLDAIF
jgi:hypothetical protein